MTIPGGPPNMQQIMKQAQRMQQDILAAQEELAQAEVQGSAGGGLVTATVSGTGELKTLRIDPSAIDVGEGADPADIAETIADLVVAAVRDATANASELQSSTVGPLTQGLGGFGLPGM